MSWTRIISLAVGFIVMDMLVDILMLTIWTRHHLEINITTKKEQINDKEEDSRDEEQEQ